MAVDEDSSSTRNGQPVRLYLLTGVILVYFCVELILSHITHSLTLLIDSYHTLYNIMTLGGCLLSVKMSREKSLQNTFGWARVEVVGMLVSILSLGALCFSVVVEAIQTMIHSGHTDAMHHPLIILSIAGVGLALNLICFLVIGGFHHIQESFVSVHVDDQFLLSVTIRQNIGKHMGKTRIASCSGKTATGIPTETTALRRQVMLDFFRDISCCLIVIICSCLVYYFGGEIALFADPLLSILSVVMLVVTTLPLVKESGLILLQTIPEDIDINDLKSQLKEQFPCILNIHDLHVWRLARNRVICTCHLVLDSPDVYTNVADKLEEFFSRRGMCTTVQPEFHEHGCGSQYTSTDCLFVCNKAECENRTCCQDTKPCICDGVTVDSTVNPDQEPQAGSKIPAAPDDSMPADPESATAPSGELAFIDADTDAEGRPSSASPNTSQEAL